MRRYRLMPISPTACSRHRRRWCARPWRSAAFGLATLALAGCSSFGSGQAEKTVDPNVFPADYKAGLMAFLQNNPFDLVGTREAAVSPPELKPFGSESRYVTCLRATGPDWRKDKMIVYFGGAINQFVDAGEQCKGAAYQPYPELPAMLTQLRKR